MPSNPTENVERERRFLVDEPTFLEGASWSWIAQAYVFAEGGYAIRVRLEKHPGHGEGKPDLERASLTAKGPRIGTDRAEYEVEVAPSFARSIIKRSGSVIEKKRYSFPSSGQVWDVDVFEGENLGLIIAELEGTNISDIKAPWWAIREITGESRFNNDGLVKNPVSRWPDSTWKSQSIWD